MTLVDIIVGARPNLMKIAPITKALDGHEQAGGRLRYRLVHTGQHYDANMSDSFFAQLSIRTPNVNLGAGSGTQAEQTAAIMLGYEKLLATVPCNLCIVVGDVTSTMACSIVAAKAAIPVAHVEGGLRSGDWSMPEEINRIVTDSLSRWYFTTSEVANTNLRNGGAADEQILFVGNTMIDTLLANRESFRPPEFWGKHRLMPSGYLVLTMHRPSNVDDLATLNALLTAVCNNARGLPIVFPAHPRTAQKLAQLSSLPANLLVVGPQPYLEFNYLVSHARAVITDSGGITEETTVLGVPCMTLRNSTERPETVTVGTNELLGTDPAALKPALDRLFAGGWKHGEVPALWDGRSAERIVAHLERLLCS